MASSKKWHHRDLDLTAVRRRNRIEWANAHIRWCLALWRGVHSSRMNPGFHCTGQMADRRRVGEWFADVNVVDRVAHAGGGFMVWAGVCYGE